VGDFNNDGKSDLVVSHGGVDWRHSAMSPLLLNTCPCAGIHLDAVPSKSNLTLSWPLPYPILFWNPRQSQLNKLATRPQFTSNKTAVAGEITLPLDQAQNYFRLRKL